MGCRRGVGGFGTLILLFLAFPMLHLVSDAAPATFGGGGAFADESVLAGKNLPTLEKNPLKLTAVAAGPVAVSPEARFPLVLAAKRTKRPDVLDNFNMYNGGWDIMNKHYWAVDVPSDSLYSAMDQSRILKDGQWIRSPGFLFALLWLVSFGFALGIRFCCRQGVCIKDERSLCKERACLMLLLLFTFVALVGCVLLCVGQAEFHGDVLDTLNFAVNQSDFTVQILRNVSDFLSSAKSVNIEEVYLSQDAQNDIDKLNSTLNNAANAIYKKTDQNAGKFRGGIGYVHCTLIIVACLMLLLAVLGFAFSLFGYKHTIYIFATSGWLLVACTFILCGIFLVVKNATVDTCTAMTEWIRYPHAESALSNVLPCVDEQTTNLTLYQSKEVIYQLVNIVNTVIYSIANSDATSQKASSFYNQSGPLVPPLCSPYDFQLRDRNCTSEEVSFAKASALWQNYTCMVSGSGSCVNTGRLTPGVYNDLVMAVNVTYALNHYTPLLLSLQDCKFARETFNTITTLYCPQLENDLRMVNSGLALISAGVLLCLILWLVNANRPQKGDRVCAVV